MKLLFKMMLCIILVCETCIASADELLFRGIPWGTSATEIEKANISITKVDIEKLFKTDIDFTVIDMNNTTNTFLDDYGIKVVGILGNDFLRKNKLKINYKQNYFEYENYN